jgi:hypothetical protein
MEERGEVTNEEGIGVAEEGAAEEGQFARIVEKLHPRCVISWLTPLTSQ